MSAPRGAAAKRAGRDHKRTGAPRPAAANAPAAAAELCREVDAALAQGRTDVLPPQAVQAVMAAVCRLYSAQLEAGGQELPLRPDAPVSATDVMRTASGLLRAADLQVFELGMWVSYTGR